MTADEREAVERGEPGRFCISAQDRRRLRRRWSRPWRRPWRSIASASPWSSIPTIRPTPNGCGGCSATAASCRRSRWARGPASTPTCRGGCRRSCSPRRGTASAKANRKTMGRPVACGAWVAARRGCVDRRRGGGELRSAAARGGRAGARRCIPTSCFPAPPPGHAAGHAASGSTRGWRLLQANDVAAADREFGALLETIERFRAGESRRGLRGAGAAAARRRR